MNAELRDVLFAPNAPAIHPDLAAIPPVSSHSCCKRPASERGAQSHAKAPCILKGENLAPPAQLSHGDRLMANREPSQLAAIHLDSRVLQGF